MKRPNKLGLTPGATNTFNFVIANPKPFTTPSLAARVNFNRILLEGGKAADPLKGVEVDGT